MNYVSTCPACSTRFTVRLEQLAEQAGQVKCGQCQTVYNALPNLLQVNDTSVATESYPEFTTPAEPDLEAETSLDIASEVEPEQAAPAENIAVSGATESANEIATEATEVIAVEPEVAAELVTQSLDSGELAQTLDSSEPNAKLAEPEDATPNAATSVVAKEPSAEAEVAMVEAPANPVLATKDHQAEVTVAKPVAHFVKPAQQADVPKSLKKYPRVLQYFALITLIFLALAQSIYFTRSALAQSYPALKPSLLAMCQPLRCNIELAKNLSLLEIEDSDLHEDKQHAGVLRLTSSLLNRASFAQAYPNIELTLTDDNEIALLRRTIKPQEYADKDSHFAQGIAAGEGIRIDLALTAADERVSGYRVLLTY